MNQLKLSTADSAHVCTATDHAKVSGNHPTPPLHPNGMLTALALDVMAAQARLRVKQSILRAASAAYIALDIPPPDCHVIDVLMSIPGLAGVELTDAGGL